MSGPSLLDRLWHGGVELQPTTWVALLQELHRARIDGYLQQESGAGCLHFRRGRLVGAVYGEEVGLAGLVQSVVHGRGCWRLQRNGTAVDDIDRDTRAIIDGIRQVLASYGLVVEEAADEVSLLDDSGPHTAQVTRPLATRVYRGFQPPKVGTRLGRCELLGEIGRGVSSIVYRARHLGLDIDVAVKVLLPGDEGDEGQVTAHEARLLARLNHQAVLRVLDFDDSERWPYLVVELVDGPSLERVLQEQGAMDVDLIMPVMRQVAEGLAHAHAQEGIIHCDLKPGNVLLTQDGQAKIADLGLARITRREATAETVFDPGTSRELRIAGTPFYISPEQVASGGVEADHRSDIYALGAMTYHLLAGRPPYEDDDPMRVMVLHLEGQYPDLRTRLRDCPDQVSDLVNRCLARRPADRPADYGALLEAFDLTLAVCGSRRRPSVFGQLWQRLGFG